MHVNIILPLACVTAFFDGRGFAEYHFNRLWSDSKNRMVYLDQILHTYLF